MRLGANHGWADVLKHNESRQLIFHDSRTEAKLTAPAGLPQHKD
jgi:hypothetical protein